MSHYPTQDASFGATGSDDQCPDAALIFADTQGLNMDDNRDYIANFDLDLLASELWPESTIASYSTSSDGCQQPQLGSTFLSPQEEDLLNLGSVNPNDVFRAQQSLSSSNAEECLGYNSTQWYQQQSEPSQYESLTHSFQQMPVFQDYNFQNESFHYGHTTAPAECQDQPTQSYIPNPDVTYYGEEAGVPSTSSGNQSSRKRKGHRHRHQRQFLESVDARKERSRTLNNESSVLYRKKMRILFEEARVELDELERKNQQLGKRFHRLKEFCSVYRSWLEAMNVPMTNAS